MTRCVKRKLLGRDGNSKMDDPPYGEMKAEGAMCPIIIGKP